MKSFISQGNHFVRSSGKVNTGDGRFIPALNGLRGGAALLVLVSHSSQRGLLPDFLGREAGHMGVMLFFTLSAFLMTVLYFYKQPTNAMTRNFWVARFGRVYPLHFILLSIALIAGFLGADKEIFPYAIGLDTYLSNILFVGRFNVFWTISAEFQFYLLFGFGWVFAHRFKNPSLFMAIAACVASTAVFIDIYPYPSGAVYKTIQFFAVGVLAGLIFNTGFLKNCRILGDIFLGVAVILFILSTPIPSEKILGLTYNGFWSPWLLFLSFSIVLGCSIAKGPISVVFGSRLGVFLGEISFGVYLLHIPVIHFLKHLLSDLEPTLIFFAAFALTVALANITYRYIENPIRRWFRDTYSTPALKREL